jgi:hypothetical protein
MVIIVVVSDIVTVCVGVVPVEGVTVADPAVNVPVPGVIADKAVIDPDETELTVAVPVAPLLVCVILTVCEAVKLPVPVFAPKALTLGTGAACVPLTLKVVPPSGTSYMYTAVVGAVAPPAEALSGMFVTGSANTILVTPVIDTRSPAEYP